MSESQTNTADPTASKGLGMKPVDIDAPYEHAPPKDGDPWTTLLTPELEADTLRCNAWKDEVQNLLIFAGLFSAVVTAFVVESYKLLLPDPNDAITGLLFHIASGLNNTSPFPPSVSPESILTPFSRTPSAIRINVFWFISLILSLTTVLVGTIALQWLREHQLYGGYSSKEKLAILHMRLQAIDAWYLPKVFAALPLLLQAALVLFLAGLIDFSLPLGPKLTIPVSIIVGLTLLFLAATIFLPSLQGLSFFCGLYPRKTLPTPCPFKSPQSHAFRTLVGIVLRAMFHIFPSPSLHFVRSSPTGNTNDWKWVIKNRSLLITDHLVPSVRSMWNQRTWPTLDREWLSLRDACHQRILDSDLDLYQHRSKWETGFPHSDVTRYLAKVANQTPGFKHTDSFLAALVHCFNELAESIWLSGDRWTFERIDRHDNYFELLYSELSESCSLSNFLLHGGIYKYNQLNVYGLSDYIRRPEVKPRVFSAYHTMIFLRILLKNHTSPALLQYHQELWMRVLHFSCNIAPLTPITIDGSELTPVPTIIKESAVLSMIDKNPTPDRKYFVIVNILTTIFQLAASRRASQDRTIDPLLAHPWTAEMLDPLAMRTDDYLEWVQIDTLTKQDVLRDIDDRYTQLFKFISNYLNEEPSDTSSSSQNTSLDILFYLSSIFSWHLLYWRTTRKTLGNPDSSFGQALKTLIDTLHKTWTSGQKNDILEKRFKGDDEGVERFSDKWWNRIFKRIGHRIIERDSDSDIWAKSSISSEDDTEDATSPLPATSLGNLDHTLALNTIDNDNPLKSRDLDPPPEIPGHEPAPSVVNHADDNIPHSLSDLPTILHHPRTSTEGAGTINDLPLCHSRSSFDGSNEMRPLGEDHTVAGAAPPSISQPLPPPSAADPNGVVPQEATGNGTGDSNGNEHQLGGLHLAIDVGPSTGLEEVGAEIPGSRGDDSLDEAQPDDAVIRVESSV